MSTMSKKSAKTSAANKKGSSTHPSFIVMISECIANSEEARTGVSRPTIKKYLEDKYKLEITPAVTTNINRAITSGEEKGTFTLPKGLSGKVKLTPKAKAEVSSDTKENKPVKKTAAVPAKKSTAKATKKKPSSAAKAKAVTKKAAATKPKPKPAVKKTTTAKKPATSKKTTVKKTALAKKAPAKKTSTTTKAKPVATKPAATKRKSPTKRT